MFQSYDRYKLMTPEEDARQRRNIRRAVWGYYPEDEDDYYPEDEDDE